MGLTKKEKGIIGGATAVLLAYLATRKAVAPAEGEFILSDLVIEPSEVEVGDPVSISCIATNIGEQRGSRNITLEVT